MSIAFTKAEKEFFKSTEYARVATVTKNGEPHVTPVLAIYDDKTNSFYFAIDLDSQKYANLSFKPEVAMVIDLTDPERGVMIRGNAVVIEHGKDFEDAWKIMARISYYKRHPYHEGDLAIVKAVPEMKSVWGKINANDT